MPELTDNNELNTSALTDQQKKELEDRERVLTTIRKTISNFEMANPGADYNAAVMGSNIENMLTSMDRGNVFRIEDTPPAQQATSTPTQTPAIQDKEAVKEAVTDIATGTLTATPTQFDIAETVGGQEFERYSKYKDADDFVRILAFETSPEQLTQKYGVDKEGAPNVSSREARRGYVDRLNKSGAIPYRVHQFGDDQGVSTGLVKKVDRYELAQGANQQPLYFRYYEDGTYDQLDANTFNKEKMFNYLPDDVKGSYYSAIDTSKYNNDNIAASREYILRHQIQQEGRDPLVYNPIK